MKKINLPLIVGSIILILILIIMIFPELFTDKSPYTMIKLKFSTVDGKLSAESSPFPPSDDFILGSDDMGRDVLSYIVFGTRLTIILGILVALGRFLIAIPIALSAGFGGETSKTIIKQFNIVFSAIPAVLISIIILSLDFFVSLDKTNSIIAFIIVLSVVSWAKLGSLIMERVETINKQAFIKGEVAIGKNRLKIALENVIPHLAPELIVLFFMEIARALAMIMQLGIFSVFIGNLKIIKDTGVGGPTFYNVSFEPEWASMLGTSRNMLSAAPWALLFPAVAFFICVLGFNLFGEGLRNLMQEKDSNVIPVMRKIISFDIKQILASTSKKSKVKFGIIMLVLISLFSVKYFASKNQYDIKIDDGADLLYDQVIIGTESSLKTAKLITNKMSELGIEPIAKDGYVMEYNIGQSCIPVDQDFSININDTPIIGQIHEDYAFTVAGNLDYTAMVYDATKEDLFSIEDYRKYDDKFVLINKAYYSDSAIRYLIDDIKNSAKIKGILLIAKNDEKIDNYIVNESKDIFVMLITNEFAGVIKDNIDSTITLSASVETLGTTGYNVIGMYKGSDPFMEEEAILIGMNYNYLGENGEEILQFNFELMDRLCTLYDNKRSIIFMFLDGTISDTHHGIYNMSEEFPYSSSKIKVYIDLTQLNKANFDYIDFSVAQAPFTRQLAWSMGHQLKSRLDENNIDVKELATMYVGSEYYFTDSSTANIMFWDRGIATIIIGTNEEGNKEHDIFDIGSILIEVINKNNY